MALASYLLLAIYAPAPLQAAVINVSAPSVILLDNANHIVYSKTPHLRRAPASTTKILTAMVALDHLRGDQIVKIPAFVTSIEPSKIYIKPGERYYVRDLVKATLINSANDAAETLAHAAGGSRAGFAKMMNRKARSLGANSSNFVRASGLPAQNQYSTAYDMALIMRAAEKYPFIVQTMQTRNGAIRSVAGRRLYLHNHNRMLGRIMGKTGWTRAARHCFVGSINLPSNRRVFVAMLGSHRLWRDLKTLVDSQVGRSISKKARILPNVKATPVQVQRQLKRAGYYSGRIDGILGSRSAQAIRRFQSAHGLGADGVVGPATWKKLRRF